MPTNDLCWRLLVLLAAVVPPSATPAGDRLTLKNNHESDLAVVLIDGQTTTSLLNDLPVRITESEELDYNFVPWGCEEIVAFSDGNGMLLWEPDFTSDFDQLELTLPEMVMVPLKIWVPSYSTDESIADALRKRPSDDVARAQEVYNTMNCGIDFTWEIQGVTVMEVEDGSEIVEATGQSGSSESSPLITIDLFPSPTNSCADWYKLKELGYEDGAINVYYVDKILSGEAEVNGACWSPCDPAAILISTTVESNETLAHELGHIFGLAGHYGACAVEPGSDPEGARSIMCNYDSNYDDNDEASDLQVFSRQRLSEGECFRCNLQPDSFLIQSGLRKDSPRACSMDTANGICPDITLDIEPD